MNIFLLAILFFYFPFAETVSIQVEAGSDDGSELAVGTVNITNAGTAPFQQYPTSNGRWGAARFLATGIPRGALILTTTVTVWDTVGSLVLDGTVFFQAADDAATITTTTNDISNRSRTTASVEWDVASTTSGSQVSPDVSVPLQEVVNRSGFSETSDVAVIIQLNANNTVRSRTFDGNPTKAAKLDVTYRRKFIGIW